MNRYLLFYILICFFCASSCTQKNDVVLEVKGNFYLSKGFKSHQIEILPIDEKEFFGNYSKLVLERGYVLLADQFFGQKVFIRKPDGTSFIVNDYGYGPNEYLEITDVFIDLAKGELGIWDGGLRKLLIYSLSSGKLLKKANIDLFLYNLIADDNYYYLYTGNNRSIIKDQIFDFKIIRTDKNFNEWKGMVPIEQWPFPHIHYPKILSKSNGIILHESFSPKIYQLDQNSSDHVVIELNFSEAVLSANFFNERREQSPMEKLKDFNATDLLKVQSIMKLTKDIFYIETLKKNRIYRGFYGSKNHKIYPYFIDDLYGILFDVSPLSYEDGILYFLLNSEDILQNLRIREKLIQNKSSDIKAKIKKYDAIYEAILESDGLLLIGLKLNT
jgi:hypothetical protein